MEKRQQKKDRETNEQQNGWRYIQSNRDRADSGWGREKVKF